MTTRARFTELTGPHVPALIKSIQRFDPTPNWLGWFRQYNWNATWRAGLEKREGFSASIAYSRQVRSDTMLKDTLEDILMWGGDAHFGAYELSGDRVQRVRWDVAALEDVDLVASGEWLPHAMTARAGGGYKAIPMTTKFYHMADPRRFVIYDQHFARALAELTNRVVGWPTEIVFLAPSALAPAHMPLLTAAQTFIQASWLAEDIAAGLNADPRHGIPADDMSEAHLGRRWMVCHIEMALFTLGRALQHQGRAQ